MSSRPVRGMGSIQLESLRRTRQEQADSHTKRDSPLRGQSLMGDRRSSSYRDCSGQEERGTAPEGIAPLGRKRDSPLRGQSLMGDRRSSSFRDCSFRSKRKGDRPGGDSPFGKKEGQSPAGTVPEVRRGQSL